MSHDRLAARLKATFAAELSDQVRLMNRDILALEANPTEGASLKSLFRVAHTLKGAARTADVPLVEELCHGLETLLAEARDGARRLGPEDFQLFYAAADALAEAGGQLEARQPVESPTLVWLAQRLRLGNQTPGAGQPRRAPVPPPSPARAPARPDPREDRLSVDPARLDALLASGSQLLIAEGRIVGRRTDLEAVHDAARELLGGWRRARRQLRRTMGGDGITPMSGMLEWVDGRVLGLVQQARRLAAAAAGDARAIDQASSPLIEQIRRLRVRPFSEACEALPRAARDLAGAAGKEVGLEIADTGVEADRAVIDALREALLQLLRNAVDHGIEAPERREQLGKPRRGRVRVAAELRGDRLLVSVSDDGAGLDEESIRSKLASRGEPAPAGRYELVGALLEGGTSTRVEASRISGRGVGLDVVRAAVERIHGRLDVDWEPGRGSTFTIACPPSPATIRALLARAGSETVAFPTADVVAAALVAPGDVRPVAGRATIPSADGRVPLVSLEALLGPAFGGGRSTGKLRAVIVRGGERRLALAVDELLTEREIVLRPIPACGGRYPLLNGATLLQDGCLALVLDAVALVGAAGPLSLAATAAEPTVEGRERRARVLVVEDSITTRTLEQSILEAAGYEVATAVDGLDGLEWLQANECDLVLADLEMPRMDGLALCRAVKESPRLRRIPFVLVTARESAEDRVLGLEAGADAHLGKSSFEQQGLLDTVRALLAQER